MTTPTTPVTTTLQAVGSSDITGIGIGVIAVLVILGAIAVAVLSGIIARVVVLVIVVVLAVVVWTERDHVEHSVNAHSCKLNTTFFGVHLDAPNDVKQACRNKIGKLG